MQKTIEIIKNRFPEVLLIILFSGGGVLLFTQADPKSDPNTPAALLTAIGSGIFMVLGGIFQFGFLRTIAIAPDRFFQPKELLIIGRKFLGRMILFSIIIAILVFIISQSISTVLIASFTNIDKTLPITEQAKLVPSWIPITAMLVSLAIFVKFWIFIPAVIMVSDCRLKESLALLKPIRFFKAKEVIIWLIFFISINIISLLASSYLKTNKPIKLPLDIVLILATTLISLALHLAAVRYVKAIYSKYTKQKDD